ncbi:MAG TPA: DUF488 domain-containing protein [Xanthobacteraceae bacterium]|nr:DUF488 domain-containing protein [Xanthobacteraceae bacterium]
MTAKLRQQRASGRLRIKRVYEPAAADDGLRVLVDRLWPRGVSKEKARIDLWLKDIAPSNELRRRFHGEPGQWREFVAAYAGELQREPASAAVATLRDQLRRQPVTLLYAARNETRNNAIALKDWLERPH